MHDRLYPEVTWLYQKRACVLGLRFGVWANIEFFCLQRMRTAEFCAGRVLVNASVFARKFSLRKSDCMPGREEEGPCVG